MKQVVISVSGGVAATAYVSEGVEVTIVDFDNAEAEGKSGEYKLMRCIARAKRDEKKAPQTYIHTSTKMRLFDHHPNSFDLDK